MKKCFVFLLAGMFLHTAAFAETDGAKDKTLKVDTKNSKVVWHAKKVTGSHDGYVPITSGSLILDGEKLKGGTFLMDVKSLVVTDIKDNDMNGKLTNHLKSDDFFSVEKHPQAKLVITSATPTGGDKYNISGDLTIKGISEPVTFPATVKMNAGKVQAEAKVTVDRTKYDIKFRSTNFFENLGDKAIMDDFTLDVNLVAGM
ncbi:YceI family protein [Dyadobacter tibetensis]|uniref:YceI family protein n=1 Tax=Dyadobacter tibetensis TaxID=1211851 RepID=UPI000472C6A4|nr:YceI family protein [Dyadobacter tibetensis]